MKEFKNIWSIALALLIIGVSCDSEDELIEQRIEDTTVPPVEYTSGDANFSNYVAIGNSLTAGFMDAALYNEGQASSYPNIIGQQLIEAGFTTSFNQPDINSELGFNTAIPNPDGSSGAIFGHFILDTSIPGPVPTVGGDLITAYTGNKSELNNFGVPGARLGHLENPGLAANGFYARFASAPGTSTVLGDALATNPTFFTMWIGSNDVLGYATSGGVGDDPLTTYGQAEFTAAYSSAIGKLVGAGAKGVVINVPPVLLIPYFRAVPYNPVPLEQAQADALNAGFAGFNAALDAIVGFVGHDADDAARRKVSYSAGGGNPLLIVDEYLEDLSAKFDILEDNGAITAEQRAALQPFVQARPATAADLVPLSTATAIGTDLNPGAPGTALLGISVPMSDQYILTIEEQTAIITARATYNAIISGIVGATPGVEMYDIQPLFADIAGLSAAQATQLALSPAAIAAADEELGIVYEGVKIAPDFSPSGIFSTDGIHPNPRGHSMVANELIDKINASFGSNIPKVNTTIYRTVLFQ